MVFKRTNAHALNAFPRSRHRLGNIEKTVFHSNRAMTLAQLLSDQFSEDVPDYELDQKSQDILF